MAHPDPTDASRRRVGAVIVNFNAGERLAAAIASVRGEGIEQLVVVDNASNDASADIVPTAELVRNTANVGFAAAVNQGVRHLHPSLRHIMLLNPDATLASGSLGILTAAIDAEPRAAAAGPRLIAPSGHPMTSARRFPGPMADLLETFRLTRLLGRERRAHVVQGSLLPSSGPPVWVDWVSGACVLIRREAWDRIGGFSEDFFLYGEELDWCWRAAKVGMRCLYVPEAAAEHVGGVSASTTMNPEQIGERVRDGVRRAAKKNLSAAGYATWLGTQRLNRWLH